jgi:GDPmannose 4,6-dehydratase
MMKKKVLIFGITGQDGSYLAKEFLKKNYLVYGVSRFNNLKNLKKIKVANFVNIFFLKKFSVENINKILNKKFDSIYFFGGQSKVTKSYKEDKETFESNIIPVKTILEFIKNNKKIKFFFASSGEIFGNQNSKKINEDSIKVPLSPYALAKLTCLELIKSYREMFKLKVGSFIFFNHESNLRDKSYVIVKIIKNLIAIKHKLKKNLVLGNINIKRDWGWAPEYMKIVFNISKRKKYNDYIIATGVTVSLKKIISTTCSELKIKMPKLISKREFQRKFDILQNSPSINKLKKETNYYPKIKYDQVIKKIINNEL